MWRVLDTYGLIVGLIAGLLLTSGCRGETTPIAVPLTPPLPTVAAGLAQPATATDIAAPAGQGAATSTSQPADENPGAAGTTGVGYLEFEGAQTSSFSVNSSNTTLPEDILQEIYVFAGGGGGMSPGPCEEQRGHPYVYMYERQYEPLDEMFVGTCGWQPGEVISVMLTKPDGVVISDIRDLLLYELTLDDPLGNYEIVFRGESEEIRETVAVALPEGPRLYVRGDELILYNFAPGENIRLLAYQKSPAILRAWSPFQTDPTGKLMLSLDSASTPDAYTYVAVGERSGEVFPYSPIKKPVEDTVLPMVAVERGGPFLTISGLFLRPTQAVVLENETHPVVMSVAPQGDLLTPGTIVYDARLTNQNEDRLWRFAWCARGEDTLQATLGPLTLRFLVNSTPVPMYMFVQTDETDPGGWSCRWWTTSIEYWPEDAVSELAVEYDLAAAIHDGVISYPAGAYRHVIRVTLEQ